MMNRIFSILLGIQWGVVCGFLVTNDTISLPIGFLVAFIGGVLIGRLIHAIRN